MSRLNTTTIVALASIRGLEIKVKSKTLSKL